MNNVKRLIILSEDDFKYIREKNYVLTRFVRQAIKSEQEGKWKYDYTLR